MCIQHCFKTPRPGWLQLSEYVVFWYEAFLVWSILEVNVTLYSVDVYFFKLNYKQMGTMNVADSSFLSCHSPSLSTEWLRVRAIFVHTYHGYRYLTTEYVFFSYLIQHGAHITRLDLALPPHHSPHRLNAQSQWKAIRVQTTQTQILQGPTSSHIRPVAWIVW